ncbi:MAG: HD domain-containing protein [Nitrospirae bacterium]|nr:HD domain-containing protein [Nitrospirota bacterium]
MHYTIGNEVRAIIFAIEAKDRILYEHSVETAFFALAIADTVQAGADNVDICKKDVFLAALLHDVGKIYVPDNILRKNGCLTPHEQEIIRFHPTWGAQYLNKIENLRHITFHVEQHHELPDGSGYPENLKACDISLPAKIINIADRFSAMTSDRPYRRAYTPDAAMNFIEKDINAFFGKHALKIMACLLGADRRGYHRNIGLFSSGDDLGF